MDARGIARRGPQARLRPACGTETKRPWGAHRARQVLGRAPQGEPDPTEGRDAPRAGWTGAGGGQTRPIWGRLPERVREQAAALHFEDKLLPMLRMRYPEAHDVSDNVRLYTYVQDMKKTYMKSSPPLGKVR